MEWLEGLGLLGLFLGAFMAATIIPFSSDAIYLLYHTLFGSSRYPLNQPVDFDQNGTINSADAIYLLYHTLFGSGRYPI